MKEYFDNLQEIDRTEFLRRFGQHVLGRELLDGFELKVFCNLVGTESLKCYLGQFGWEALNNLILPHNDAEHSPNQEPDREVQPGGEPFHFVIEKYQTDYVPNGKFLKSVEKIHSQQLRFFNTTESLLRASVLLVSNNGKLVHPGHYDDTHGVNKLYIGNGFHRFIAYGLWIGDNHFKPLEVYYVEEAG